LFSSTSLRSAASAFKPIGLTLLALSSRASLFWPLAAIVGFQPIGPNQTHTASAPEEAQLA
jgi:hypothetical protein